MNIGKNLTFARGNNPILNLALALEKSVASFIIKNKSPVFITLYLHN